MALTASARIKLLTAVANHLATEEWSIIDLTLSQFRLPTTDSWSGSKDAYVIQMARSADDDTLIGLAEHCGIPIEHGVVQPNVQAAFWKPDQFRLFLSHLATYKKFSSELQQALGEYGIAAFVAHKDINPTAEWQNEIELALSTCDALAALLHPGFHESKWTDQEIGFVMGRAMPVFSVTLGETPYGFIGKTQAFNGIGKTAIALAREIFDALRKNKQTQDRMAEIIVTLFENSSSFDAAKSGMTYLEELTVWKTGFAKRIREAAENNGQIVSAWGVPKRVVALLKKKGEKADKSDDEVPF
ncbi:MAG TPA: toll/interleukin-1 receptor domain-containing protein [Micropepsaceae bacterium]|nr:toll/interleukin-1 receptor domain-containing protein [Micropepsaceae bacterium]